MTNLLAQARAAALNELRAIQKFPSRTDSREQAKPPGAKSYVGFALGKVRKLDEGIVPSRFNPRFTSLHTAADALMHAIDPDFKYTSIQVNKNMMCSPHRDSGNAGMSYIIGLGDYTGGDLVITHKDGSSDNHDIRNKSLKFDGHEIHHVTPFKGERYSLVFFTVKTPRAALAKG